MECWRLDHILYTPRSLRPAVVWQALEADPDSRQEGLPNVRCPSDHTPVAAAFAARAAPVLPAAEAEALRARVAAMGQAQAAQQRELEGTLDAGIWRLEAEQAQQAAAAESAEAAEAAAASLGVAAGAGAMQPPASPPASPTEGPPACASGAKKAKGGGGKRKSPEAIALLQAKRAQVNQLRAGQQQERAALYAGLGELERCVLEDELAGVAWLEMK